MTAVRGADARWLVIGHLGMLGTDVMHELASRDVTGIDRPDIDITDAASVDAVLSGFDVAYVHLVGSPQTVRVHAEVGQRIPAHCTSTGLALLASQGADYLDHVLPTQLPAVAPETITSPEQLRREIARVRARGYSVNLGGWSEEVGGIAVAIAAHPLYGPAGLCIAVPRYRMTARWIKKSVAALTAAADEIAEALPGTSRMAA